MTRTQMPQLTKAPVLPVIFVRCFENCTRFRSQAQERERD